ncbi:hypothetical protein C475_08756 [Halosimplex carlsbadense 2-9-1]|uniref:Lipoprotein n=1 Tax=Halosimplex carlsbadense 2-9-1 TaxID=797114 RepID=M0CX69_9EURY|nr:hypothetical protein [Halosimplex carlsbadense]ELZ27012.1 hypothetical protein C475_08756 [Halosimplex carlsbadense 2-9-1]
MARWLALVALFVVALAGCSALAPDDAGPTPAETVTPVAVPADTPTETLSPPPGVAANGSVSPGALIRAHFAALDDRSFTWRLDYRRSVDRSAPVGGETASNVSVDVAERRLRVADDGSYRLTRRMTGMVGGTVYADDTGRYVRGARSNGTGYRVGTGEPSYRHYLRTGQTLGRYFPVEGSAVSTVARDGRTYYRVHVTAPPRTLAEGHAKQTITDYAATAYVTPEGLVRAVVVEYEYTLTDDRVAVSFRSEYRGVDETDLARPDWVADLIDDGGTATPGATTTTTQSPTATADAATDTSPRTATPTDGGTR